MRSFLAIFFLTVVACSPRPNLAEVVLENLNGETAQINPSQNELTVVYFLSPECPLCINYTLAFREISNQFSNDSVVFCGVHSADWFSTEEVENYQLKYNLEFEMLLDSGNQLATVLGASVTPEVFVLNSQSEVLYSGKIDNWVNELGKKKLEVSEHYLKNALLAYQNGRAIEPSRTEPKGCLIE